MCGFAGILNLDNSPIDSRLLSRMGKSLKHRGPDGQGIYTENAFGLIHQRLAILDRKHSAQPWITASERIALAANHEIYNFEELKRGLKSRGIHFRSQGDTEVIAEGFEKDGVDYLPRLVGMFALAAWDKTSRQLWLARDPFGIKPLYYFQTDKVFVFASELKPLMLHPNCPKDLSPTALEGYLGTLVVPEPLTILEGVHKLPAGHFLRVTKQNGRKVGKPTPFWKFPASRDEKLSVGELGTLIEDNVRACSRADVPVGIFLSGGVDSTALTIAAQKIQRKPVRTYSVRFEEPLFDESEFSRLVAENLQTQHTEVTFREKDATKMAEFLSANLDEPFADASLLPTYFLSRAAKESVGVVLSGEGADELFAGSPWHWSNPQSYQPRLNRMNQVFPSRRKSALRHGSLRESLQYDIANYLPSDLLCKLDRATMLTSLEARVPFLNHPFVERLLRVPSSQLIDETSGKKLLKSYVKQYLPARIVNRPKKGFSIPIDIWLFKNGSFRELILDTLSSYRPVTKHTPVAKLIDEHDKLKALNGYRIWTLFILERWMKSN